MSEDESTRGERCPDCGGLYALVGHRHLCRPRHPVELARQELVRRYRQHPQGWPDGIGGWYRPEEWTDGGERISGEEYTEPVKQRASAAKEAAKQ